MQGKKFVLATDLDGTFLGGSADDRGQLYNFIEKNRDIVGLIFVSGRDLPFISELCSGGVPWPDFVVGDVGTTIAQVHSGTSDVRHISPIPVLEQQIASLWNDNSERVRQVLEDAAGLRLQETPFRYRVSYHYDPVGYDDEARSKIEDLGLDVLISDNQYFDVLPKGVSKGPSLLRLLDHLDVPRERVLVAGDTLNDLSLFTTGLKGVAVGNSEPGLISRVKDMDTTYKAKKHGTAGIAEAIAHYNFLPEHEAPQNV